jgi:DUF971 family protein
MTPQQITPVQLDLKKDQKLTVRWQDGLVSEYGLQYLRTMCPCAACRIQRDGKDPHDIGPAVKKKPLLTVLPGNYAEPLRAMGAELVGNYALRIEWSDQHASGIYSFAYLREISPKKKDEG